MTMKTNGDMPAIPFEEVRSRFQGLPNKWTNHVGLTKREMMSMHMMAHLMSNENIASYEDQASCAIKAADALLAELEPEDLADAVADLICDLLHYSVEQGFKPDRLLAQAQMNFEHEHEHEHEHE